MPDDEETTVRQRLSRLFEAAGAGAGPPSTEPARPPVRAAPPVTEAGRSPVRAAPPATEAGRSPVRAAPPAGVPGWPRAGPDVADEPPPAAPSRLPGPGAFDPGRRGVRVLAVVAAVVVLGAGLWAWRSRPHAEPVPPVATGAASALPEPSVGGGSAGAGQLVVAVAGKVRRPGLVRLPAGARVADAVEAAGGALPGVDVALLNPARKLTDGELVVVGVTAPPAPAGAPPAAAGDGSVAGGPVNLNTATLAQLDALPGVGPVLAQRILAHREQHGGFRSVADLRQVEGIGDARYEQLKGLVTV